MMKNVLKVVGAGATIFAIGMGMVVLQPEVEAPVAEAEADIFGIDFAPRSQQEKFVQSLMDEGFEEPRVYDHNGNTMFFSTKVTSQDPLEVLHNMQTRFVDNGLNKNVYTRVPRTEIPQAAIEKLKKKNRKLAEQLKKDTDHHLEWMDDYVGGIVPVQIDEKGWMMTGMGTPGNADSSFDWIDEVVEANRHTRGKHFDHTKVASQMRYLDAFRENGRTRLTAVWSDEDYQLKKIVDEGDDLNIDPEVPMCAGCTRLAHIEGKSEDDYSNHMISAKGQSTEQVLSYYQRSLEARGWQRSGVSDVLKAAENLGWKQHADGEMMQFARGTDFMTVMVYPGATGTEVQVARSN